jgi:predicted ATPase
MEAPAFLGPYELRAEIGRGGMGVVYEAYDAKTGATIALKTIDRLEAEGLYRLKQEFRALADLQHENLVRFGELANEDGQWFFTMERIDGTTFLEYVRDASAIGFDESRLRSALAQLVEALTILHDSGRVHRDIKPSNVLVARDGRVVLLDFGLVSVASTTDEQPAYDTPEYEWSDKTGSTIRGTSEFMAPEQVEAVAVGPAADWYAVGVMLHLALTGRLPFATEDPLEALFAKQDGVRDPPSVAVPGVPPDLDALCVALLAPEPAARPRAEEIRARLGLGTRDASPAGTSVFVGRQHELSALEDALAQVRSAQSPRAVILRGEPGVGKSALVERFLASVPEECVVLSGRCYEQEKMPFGGVDSLIDCLSDQLGTLVAEDLLAGGVRYLATIFPVLNRVPVIEAQTKGTRALDNAVALRELAFGELAALVATLARKRPLVVFLDDVQWLDDDGLAVLERAFLPPSGAPCLFVGTLRTSASSERLERLTSAAQSFEVGGLSRDEARALWDALSRPESRDARNGARDVVLDEADGHPLFLMELSRAASAGRLADRGHARLQDVLWDRISERAALERSFLEMVAVAGAPTLYTTLARAAGLSEGECLTRLGSMRAAQLIRISRVGDGRYVEPYHDRVREAVLEHSVLRDKDALSRLKLRLGYALLDATPRADLASRVFPIVTHLNDARHLIEGADAKRTLAELNLLAAREARVSTAYDRALQYARIGLELIEGVAGAYELTRDLLLQRMEAAHLARHATEAHDAFARALAHVTSIEDRTLFYVRWIVLETGAGSFREAIAAAREILAELGVALPTRVTALHMVAQHAANRIVRGRRTIDELADVMMPRDVVRESVMRVLMAVVPTAYFADTRLFGWIVLTMSGMSIKHGASEVSSYAYACYATLLEGVLGDHESAAAFGRLSLALHDKLGSDALAPKVYFINGYFIVPWTRPAAAAREMLLRAREAAAKCGDGEYEAYAANGLAMLAVWDGAPPLSIEAATQNAFEIGARHGAENASVNVFARYGMTIRGLTPNPLDLGIDGSTDAEFRATLSDAETSVSLFFYHYFHAEAAYLFGETERAEQALGEARKRKQAVLATPNLVDAAFVEALVAARVHDAAPLVARARATLKVVSRVRMLRAWAKRCPDNFEVRYLIALGELERIRGRAADAAQTFARAIDAARGRGALKHEAMALELAARLARSQGDRPGAGRLFSDAAHAYRAWGAQTKAERVAAQ